MLRVIADRIETMAGSSIFPVSDRERTAGRCPFARRPCQRQSLVLSHGFEPRHQTQDRCDILAIGGEYHFSLSVH